MLLSCRTTCKHCRWNPSERAVRPQLVVLRPPGCDSTLGVLEVDEPIHIEALAAHLVVEALDVGVLHRLSGVDEMDPHAVLAGPRIDLASSELRSVVHHQHFWVASLLCDRVENLTDPIPVSYTHLRAH